MQVKGIVAAFVDVPQKDLVDFNYWYDFDHAPEFIGLPEFTVGRRYYASPECKAARMPSRVPELSNAGSSYFTTYFIDTDDIQKAVDSFRGKAAELRAGKRFFRSGRTLDAGFYRLDSVIARKGIPVSTAAMPYLGHRGVLTVLTQVPDPALRSDVGRWFREVHAPDVLSVPGAVAAMRFVRFEAPDRGRFLHLYLLDGNPADVWQEMGKVREQWAARGHLPYNQEQQQIQWVSPYNSVVPARYDFRVE